MDFIYDQLKSTKCMKLFNQLNAKLKNNNEKIGYYLLYSFDFFYIMHSLLCHYFVFKEINDSLYNCLEFKINNFII